MNRLTLSLYLLALPFLIVGCTTHSSVEVNGVPEWIAGGAKLSDEPEPLRPDPAIIHHEEESGPVELRIVKDKHKYPDPPKKEKKVEKEIEYEPGRDSRIRRLF